MQTQKQTLLEKLAPPALYHITHIDNLPAIFKHGLLAHNNNHQKVDISNQQVNNRRADIIEPFHGRSLHEYVPFYFNPRNAMLYKTQIEYGRNIVILQFSSDILLQEDAFVTTANATCQGTKCYRNINDLEKINWNLVFSRSWNGYGEHVKQAMMSEALVYKQQKLDALLAINVRYQKDADRFNEKFKTTRFQQDETLFFENL